MGAESEVDSRGRITIPKRLREELQIRPGDRFRFEEHDEAILLRRETRASHGQERSQLGEGTLP